MPDRSIPRKPVPSRQQQQSQQSTLQPGWEKKITERFRQTLSTKRMNELSRTSSHRSLRPSASQGQLHTNAAAAAAAAAPAMPRYGSGRVINSLHPDSAASLDDFHLGSSPASYSLLKSLPLMPERPVEAAHRQFRSQLQLLSEMPLRWENPGLLDDAMKVIPMERIWQEAEREAAAFEAIGKKVGKKPAWAYQDCIIRALRNWFCDDFFHWINNPPCTTCGHGTVAVDHVAPTPEDVALGANKVELYECSNERCRAHVRFPRYSDAFVLLQTRRGRSGEWANCFSMLCRAMGARVRWVWNSEDLVWTEVYSDHRKRWVHVDACERAFDNPMIYRDRFKRKLGYCIAFSRDGATDVTTRYCPNPRRFGCARNKCPEAVLLYVMDEIRAMRRTNMPKDEKFRLEGEDMREDRELRHYYVSTMISEIADLIPPQQQQQQEQQQHQHGGGRRPTPDEQKLAEERSRQQQQYEQEQQQHQHQHQHRQDGPDSTE